MRADAAAPRYLTATPRSRAHDTREAGLALVARVNRWVVAGAVVLAGAVTGVTAHAFHAHAAPAAQTATQAPGSAGQAPAVANQGGLQGPSQAPQSAPAAVAPAPVVSGGS